MKTITIPEDSTRLVVVINGTTYVYAAGETVSVPDEVAAAIMESQDLKPRTGGDTSEADKIADLNAKIKALTRTMATIADDVDVLDGRVDALDDETTGAVPALDGRVDALDTPETGAIALLDARVTALETAQNGGGGGGT